MTFLESRERLAAAFETLASVLAKYFVRAPTHPPKLDFVDDPRSDQLAEVVPAPDGGCHIRIHRPLLDRLEQMIGAECQALKVACLKDLRSVEQTGDTESALQACVLDFAETFALLHECCHFCCGHWDVLGAGASLDEGELHLAADGSEPAPIKALGAYYLELEADASALQLLLQKLDFGSFRHLSAALGQPFDDADDATLFALNDRDRLIGFRVVLAAVWVVIQLFENRKAKARAIQRYHPLPSARLLGAIFTIMAQYAELTSEDFDAGGLISQPVDASQETDLQQFFRQVLTPVLSAGWRLSEDATAHEGFRTAPVWIAQEIGRLLLGEALTTTAGQELLAVHALRPAMTKRLGPLRYLPHVLP